MTSSFLSFSLEGVSVRASIAPDDECSFVSRAWLQAHKKPVDLDANLLVQCVSVEGSVAFVLPFLPADMEDLDVSLGQNAIAYHCEVLSSSMPGKFLWFPVRL